MRVGDLDRDGALDLPAGSSSTGLSGLEAWPGNGRGDFVLGTTLPLAGSGPCALGDWNPDGRLDLVCTGAWS